MSRPPDGGLSTYDRRLLVWIAILFAICVIMIAADMVCMRGSL